MASWLALTTSFTMAACSKPVTSSPPATVRPNEKSVITIQSYDHGLAEVHATNPDVRIRLDRDPARPEEPILVVDYPEPTGDPAGRDIWCDSENRDWTVGHALSFQVKSAHSERLSVSLFDRNRVVYTTWIDLQGNAWQPVRIAFHQLRPNPYFQPPDAKTGAPLDLSDVKGFAFAPHDRSSGQLRVSKIVVTE